GLRGGVGASHGLPPVAIRESPLLEEEMKIELLHSITHDGQEYLPGLHELPDALAAQFLKFEWAAQPFAAAEVKAGAVREAPGPNLQLEKPTIAKAGGRGWESSFDSA